MAKTVFITGATSGFGKACANIFAQHGWNIVITGRRTEKLQEIAAELSEKYKIKTLPLTFDVQDKTACFEAVKSLPQEWQHIDLLINNAGLALGRDNFDEADLSDWDTMIDTNVKGLLYITKAVLPLIPKTGGGQIVNLGSVAGKQVYVKGNVYCGTKAAVDAISQGMRIDLLPHKIKVTAIHPGAADTEFGNVRFKGDAQTAASVYDGYQPLSAEDVADTIFYCANLPAHVCINDLVIMPTAQASPYYIFKE